MLTFSPTRRDFLRLGGLAFGGLTLSDILRLRAHSAEAAPTERNGRPMYVLDDREKINELV